MLNDNENPFEVAADRIISNIEKQQTKKNYPVVQPPVIPKEYTQLTKVNVSLFSFNWKAKS
jgi:hypothetical protein